MSSSLSTDTIGDQIRAITKWFLTAGGRIHSAVEIAHGDQTGYFLRVRDGHILPPESEVVSCPDTLVLSVQSIDGAEKPWSKHFLSWWKDSPEVITRFFLMEQALLAEKSLWSPYIEMLPQPWEASFDTPLWYSSADCDWIKGTNLSGARNTREQQWSQEYREGMDLLREHDFMRYRSFQSPLHDECKDGLILYKWAATVLTSRCFSSSAFFMNKPILADVHNLGPGFGKKGAGIAASKKHPMLLPVFDLANHHAASNVVWRRQHASCAFNTRTSIEGGKEVSISYDRKGNEELIMGYGFSIFNNNEDTFTLLQKSFSGSRSLIDVTKRQHVLWLEQEQSVSPDHDRVASLPSNDPGRLDVAVKNPEMRPLVPESNLIPTTFSLRAVNDVSFFQTNQLLTDIVSILLANPRELQSIQVTSERFWIFNGEDELTRNKLEIILTLLTQLKHKFNAITQYDDSLPPWPANDRQFHAARYRRSQLSILHSNIAGLRTLLKSTSSKCLHFVRLQDIIASTNNAKKPNELRNAVFQVLRTRDEKRIHETGHAPFVFTLWLCKSWLQQSTLDKTKQFEQRLTRWLHNLTVFYGCPPIGGIGSPWQFPSLPRRQAGLAQGGDAEKENLANAKSWMDTIRVVAEKYPHSIFADLAWNVDFLRWSLNIVQQEGLFFPRTEALGELLTDTADVWVLFMEG